MAPSEWAEPAALITADAGHLFAASLLQALFAVPQLRLAIKHLHLNVEESNSEIDRKYLNEKSYHTSWLTCFRAEIHEIHQLFAALDYTQRSYLEVTAMLHVLNVRVVDRFEPPGVQTGREEVVQWKTFKDTYCSDFILCVDVLDSLTRLVIKVTQERTGMASSTPSGDDGPSLNLASLFDCAISPTPLHNDLYACLDAYFHSRTEQGLGSNDKIGGGFLPSTADVLVVRIGREPPTTGPREIPIMNAIAAALNSDNLSQNSDAREPFQYPAILHADQWAADKGKRDRYAEDRVKIQDVTGRVWENLRKLEILVGAKVTCIHCQKQIIVS